MMNHWTFFAFPLNLLIAALWIWGWVMMWRRHSRAVRVLLSPSATISAFVLLILSCLWIGLSGDRTFVESLIFVTILLYVQTVLLLVTLRGWKTPAGDIRWRFLLLHSGLLLAVGAGFWGAPDSSEMRVALERGQETQVAYNMDGTMSGLDYTLELKDVHTEYSAAGGPVDYEAVVSVDGAAPVSLTVNNPYSVSLGEDIYLASVNQEFCILQIVSEPWKYFALFGILMLLTGAFMLFIKGPRR